MALAVLDDSQDALLPWVDPNYLQQFGLANPLAYFRQCPAFDARSNTADCLNQGLGPRAMAAALRKMVGVQYEVLPTEASPQLITIGMYLRRGPEDNNKELLKVYYILEGMIYRAPSLGDVFLQRIAACAHELSDALNELRDAVTVLPGGHCVFPFSDSLPEPEEDEGTEGKQARPGRKAKRRKVEGAGPEVDSIILNLWNQHES
mmetsp:Transcript_11097/g.33743  ORF Transcript_11097/g.33743 Transcript_11097/m.33743 type:complete len:205 (+) Transcript_11097:351-965(+)